MQWYHLKRYSEKIESHISIILIIEAGDGMKTGRTVWRWG